jgi:hypothetical protein
MDILLFAESLLAWHVANYAFSADPARGDVPGESFSSNLLRSRWSIGVAFRSTAVALVLAAFGRLDGVRLVAAAAILLGSILTPWIRRTFIPVEFLLEFELGVNGAVTLLLWVACTRWPADEPPVSLLQFNQNQLSAICLCAALLLYMIHGGNLLVRGILKKAGGMPDADEPGFESEESYAHGRMIGQIERIIVVLIVMGGNLQALAFFFAAKGLIRSKELEKRTRAEYFLLGSLASFLIALAAGLILQKSLVLLWR